MTSTGFMAGFDRALFHFVNGSSANPVFDGMMPFLSGIGDLGAIWLVIIAGLGALGLVSGRKIPLTMALSGFIAFAVCAVAGEVIEEVVARPRPFAALPDERLIVPEKESFSFPSGTTTAAFAASTGMILAARRLLGGVRWWGWGMLVLAAVIGYSRVYVGVHWPTDVLAGAALGTLGGYFGAKLATPALTRTRKYARHIVSRRKQRRR